MCRGRAPRAVILCTLLARFYIGLKLLSLSQIKEVAKYLAILYTAHVRTQYIIDNLCQKGRLVRPRNQKVVIGSTKFTLANIAKLVHTPLS